MKAEADVAGRRTIPVDYNLSWSRVEVTSRLGVYDSTTTQACPTADHSCTHELLNSASLSKCSDFHSGVKQSRAVQQQYSTLGVAHLFQGSAVAVSGSRLLDRVFSTLCNDAPPAAGKYFNTGRLVNSSALARDERYCHEQTNIFSDPIK